MKMAYPLNTARTYARIIFAWFNYHCICGLALAAIPKGFVCEHSVQWPPTAILMQNPQKGKVFKIYNPPEVEVHIVL